MAKYHLKESGDPGKCTARLRPCPLGASQEEHYSSPEAARKAYEMKMAAQTTKVTPSNSPKPVASPRELELTRSTIATFEAMATPEALAAWREAPPNSFRHRLASMVAHREEQLAKGVRDDQAYASLIMMSAAGERSGISRNLRNWSRELVDWEMAEELNARYRARLAGLPLEPTQSSENLAPYAVDPNRKHSPETLTQAIEAAKEELAFVAPLCEAYDKRFFSSE